MTGDGDDPVGLEALAGASYGPLQVRVAAEKVAEFVAATGDDPGRWVAAAPPGYASALLFAIAPEFLASEAVAGYTAVLIHSDQRFAWHRPLAVDSVLDLTARVESVRRRGPMHFVGFSAAACDESGAPVLESQSTFLMGQEPAKPALATVAEPAAEDRAAAAPLSPLRLPALGADIPEVARSASRVDLIRYAGATGDWNPIHWDHDAAVAAGLPGIVVHGLLMASWITSVASSATPQDRSLRDARFRFRAPLLAGRPAVVVGSAVDVADGLVALDMSLRAESTDLVMARVSVDLGDAG